MRKIAMSIACLIVVLLLICIFLMKKNSHKPVIDEDIYQVEIDEDVYQEINEE